MVIHATIENIPSKKNKLRRVLTMNVKTDIEAIGNVVAVAELDSASPLAKEIDGIVTEMMALKKAELVSNTKKLVAKKRAKAVK